MALGRPSSYSEELAQSIAAKLAQGIPMSRICEDDGMPHYATIMRWQNENAAFRELSARAKQDGTHVIADECLRIADDTSIDPAHKRIMVETRIRLIGKWNSRAYGDKQAVEHSGPDGGPIRTESAVDLSVALKGLPDEDLEALERIAQKIAGPKEG